MPPEYVDNLLLSKESDIYSLGVIIVEIVTGHRKYPEETSNEEFTKVRNSISDGSL
jgi:serine/threonine protein kinase